MARRKSAEMELLPAEDEQPTRGKKKLVEAEHTIKYSAPVPVTVEEPEADELIEIEDFEEAPERKRNKPKNERAELRKRLTAQGVTASSQLKLSIERYLHSDSLDSGTMAEKAYCTKYGCNEAHITGEDYLDVARQFGPGRYWFTLRLNNIIVTQWERRLDATPAPMAQAAINGDPTSPQVIVMPGQQAVVQTDPFADLDKTLKVVERLEKMRQAFGLTPAQNPEPAKAQLSPEEQLATVLLTDPDVKKKAIRNLLGSNGDNSETGTLELLLSHAGEIGKAIEGIVDRIFGNINQMRSDNGTSQMAPQAVPQIGRPDSQWPQPGQGDQTQIQQEGAAREAEIRRNGLAGTGEGARGNLQPQVTPQDELLYFLIDACEANAPIEQVSARINLAMIRNPELSDSLDALINLPIDQLLALSVTLRPSLANAPHAQAWLETLVQALTQEGEGDEAAIGN